MTPPYRNNLCPTDLSPAGDAAVAVAYTMAAQGGKVHLLHVTETVPVGATLSVPYVPAYMPSTEEREDLLTKARQQMARSVPAQAARRGVETEFHVVDGFNAAVAIEEEARRLQVDAVVMGTHGRTGIGRILMGSVAATVVRRLDVPVILVRESPTRP